MARRYQAVSIGTFQRRSAPSIISNSKTNFDKEKLNLIKTLNNFHNLIVNGSKGCRDLKTDNWKQKPNNFEVMTFEEYKQNKDE